MKELLRFEKVSYAYEERTDDREALEDCSVSICPRERIAVLGSNGAGKSTFFLLANGVLRPREGRILLDGQLVGRRGLNLLRRNVGLVFQDPDVQILGGTVEEEISFGPINLGLDKVEVRRRVDAAVTALHLEQLKKRAPQYLSGGEKKRVSIADVLAMKPRLMLLDEPAAGLDPAGGLLLEEHLETLGEQGLALLVATHDVDFAWRWAQRILVFCGGRLVADAVPKEVFSDAARLRQWGLRQPMLFRVGQVLQLDHIPRTMEELEATVGKLKRKEGSL